MTVSPLSAGLSCRCPRCGRGKLFKGYLTVVDRCAACGTDLSKADSGDGPAVFLIFIVGGLVIPLAFWLESSAEPPIWVHMLVWPVFILGLSLLLLRPAKALLVALQYKHRASDSGHVNYD
ncbi:MAG: DUF983 domain-containing protein [Kiloniellales bacterium]